MNSGGCKSCMMGGCKNCMTGGMKMLPNNSDIRLLSGGKRTCKTKSGKKKKCPSGFVSDRKLLNALNVIEKKSKVVSGTERYQNQLAEQCGLSKEGKCKMRRSIDPRELQLASVAEQLRPVTEFYDMKLKGKLNNIAHAANNAAIELAQVMPEEDVKEELKSAIVNEMNADEELANMPIQHQSQAAEHIAQAAISNINDNIAPEIQRPDNLLHDAPQEVLAQEVLPQNDMETLNLGSGYYGGAEESYDDQFYVFDLNYLPELNNSSYIDGFYNSIANYLGSVQFLGETQTPQILKDGSTIHKINMNPNNSVVRVFVPKSLGISENLAKKLASMLNKSNMQLALDEKNVERNLAQHRNNVGAGRKSKPMKSSIAPDLRRIRKIKAPPKPKRKKRVAKEGSLMHCGNLTTAALLASNPQMKRIVARRTAQKTCREANPHLVRKPKNKKEAEKIVAEIVNNVPAAQAVPMLEQILDQPQLSPPIRAVVNDGIEAAIQIPDCEKNLTRYMKRAHPEYSKTDRRDAIKLLCNDPENYAGEYEDMKNELKGDNDKFAEYYFNKYG